MSVDNYPTALEVLEPEIKKLKDFMTFQVSRASARFILADKQPCTNNYCVCMISNSVAEFFAILCFYTFYTPVDCKRIFTFIDEGVIISNLGFVKQ